ncbi:MAG: DUF2796 domain-containing protein [Oligoflexia bacterium]|nr:DUF2796 domain-containing protein [Oligoflexia bacterium]
MLCFIYRNWIAYFTLGAAVFLGNLSPSLAGTQNHKAHVHGNGKIDIALESPTKAIIELDFPGDSIFGFEHQARSAKDKQAEAQAFQKLRTQTDSIVQFDPSLGCQYKVNKVELEKEDHDADQKAESSGGSKSEHHGEHADVNASYEVNCAKPMTGSQIKVPMMTLFPKIKKISVQILKESGQTQKEISNADEAISL